MRWKELMNLLRRLGNWAWGMGDWGLGYFLLPIDLR